VPALFTLNRKTPGLVPGRAVPGGQPLPGFTIPAWNITLLVLFGLSYPCIFMPSVLNFKAVGKITVTGLLIACLSAFQVNAQVITVIDKISREPLPLVSLERTGSNKVFYTNDKGQASLPAFQQEDSLQVKVIGYQSIRLAPTQLKNQQFTIALSESSFSLEEVVVSASRFAGRKEEVPQQIQVLKSRELQFMNQPTLPDVLQQTGNILVQKSQLGGGSPIIRGFEANKVLLVVDGVRMNNAIYRGGHLQNSLTLDNTLLDRVEVVYGPGSVVYGSDALGGVMHFYTRRPQLAADSSKTRTQTQAFIRYGTAAQEKTGHLDFNLGWQKVGLLTSFTVSDFGDLRQGTRNHRDNPDSWLRRSYISRNGQADEMVTNPKPRVQVGTAYRQYDFMQKALFAPQANISHELNLQYSTSSDIPRYDRLTQMAGNNLRYAEWYYGPQDRLLASYIFHTKNATRFYDQVRVTAAYQFIEESRQDRTFHRNNRNSRIEQVGIFSVNADFEKELRRQELRYGLEAIHNEVDSRAFTQDIVTGLKSPLDTRYPDGGASMQSVAAYFTHVYKLNPQLVLSEGLRFSQVNLKAYFKDKTFFPFPFQEVRQDNGSLNGNLGMVYMPGTDWRMSVLGSTGFRAPNVDDLAKVFESVPGNVVVPNPNLKPEYTYNAEISLAKSFHNRLRLEAVGYYTWLRQALITRLATFNGQDSIPYNGQLSQVNLPVNAGKAYIYGSSLNLAADISGALSFTSSLNYTFGRMKTDTADYPLDHIPPVFGKAGLQLKLPRFRGEFFVLYHGWKRVRHYNMLGEDNFPFATPRGMPAWHTFNLRTAYQVGAQWQIQAALENILDRNYRVFASNIGAPGRNLVVTLRGTF
jgi:hemoglobin/transferrin/lactoferrin receptor protein